MAALEHIQVWADRVTGEASQVRFHSANRFKGRFKGPLDTHAFLHYQVSGPILSSIFLLGHHRQIPLQDFLSTSCVPHRLAQLTYSLYICLILFKNLIHVFFSFTVDFLGSREKFLQLLIRLSKQLLQIVMCHLHLMILHLHHSHLWVLPVLFYIMPLLSVSQIFEQFFLFFFDNFQLLL